MMTKHALLLVIALLCGCNASAQSLIARGESGDYVRIENTPCELGGWFKAWSKATFHYHGKGYASCWRIQGQVVFVLDSEGDVSPIPMGVFQRDDGNP